MKNVLGVLMAGLLFSTPVLASGSGQGQSSGGAVCVGFGPQTPRDIDQTAGENTSTFVTAPPASEMNLCNIHFHKNA